jgi:5-methylcytosine-specific restriction enzyme subunit McrC
MATLAASLPVAATLDESIVLTEYRETLCDLAEEDAAFLATMRQTPIAVRRAVEGPGYLLNPGPHVGVLYLPSGRLVRCQPKLPVENVLFMLATALGFASPFRDEPVAFERVEELFDFVVDHFANLVEARLAQGLYRSYVEREENLLAVRGRIAIAEDVRRNHVLRHRTFCRYAELTWDVPENRIVRQAVYVAAQLVRQNDLRLRLGEIDRLLGELDPAPLPLSVFDRFTYHRLNDDYEPIHRLCRLILEGASVSEHLGEFGFRAFLLDMNRLFEAFVSAALLERAVLPFSVHPQFPATLDEQSRVKIRPDLLLTWRGLPVLPADCKYKRLVSDQYPNADLYQMLAYCTALDLPRGALIYPRHESDLTGEVAVRHSEVRIRFFDVDLGAPHEALPGVMDRLWEEIVAWSGAGGGFARAVA